MVVDMRFTPEICDSVGNQLKSARTAKKDSQKKLAGILGVSRQMIIRYEQGKVAPTGEALTRAVRYMGGLNLPGYEYKLTAEILERARPTTGPIATQIELPLGLPQEFSGATVRVTRNEGSIEIFAVVGGPGRR